MTCAKCKKNLPRTKFSKSPSNKKTGLSSYCKSCASENARKWYREHRTESLAKKKIYSQMHFQEIKQRMRQYFLDHRERILEHHNLFKLRKKLEIWLQEIGEPIIKSDKPDDCSSCGFLTRLCELYFYKGQKICVSCLRDLRDTSLIPRKRFIFPKRVCSECGREHLGNENICVDCKVRKKRKLYQSTWTLMSGADFLRLGELKSLSTEDMTLENAGQF